MRALLERDGTLDRSRSTLVEVSEDEGSAVERHLRASPNPEVDRALLDIATDPELHVETRVPALVVLCRPGNGWIVPRLAESARTSDSDTVMESILLRIHRCGARTPESLRSLLESPWDTTHLWAGVAITACGDDHAPSAVRDMLLRACGDRAWRPGPWARLAVLAAARVVANSDPARADAYRAAYARMEERPHRRDEKRIAEEARAVFASYDAWLRSHPERLRSDWEVRRAASHARIESDPRLRVRTVEDVLERATSGLDIGAATLAVAGVEESEFRERLASLDRLAAQVAERIRGARSPRETLERMQAEIVPDTQRFLAGLDPSDMDNVLRARAGNCVGWTAVFLAVAERLNLPLHAVFVPKHVFVRWDDGTNRINFDPSNDGAVLSDEEYARRFGASTAMGHLRNMTHAEFLSVVLSNDAIHEISQHGTPDRAVRSALAARALHRANDDALFTLIAAFVSDPSRRPGPDELDALLSECSLAAEVSGRRNWDPIRCALLLGLHRRAKEIIDSANHETTDEDAPARAGLCGLWARAGLGEAAQARADFAAVAGRLRGSSEARALEIALSFAAGAPDAEATLERVLDGGAGARTPAERGLLRALAAHMIADLPHPSGREAAMRAALHVIGPATALVETPLRRSGSSGAMNDLDGADLVRRHRFEVGLVHAWILDQLDRREDAEAVRRRCAGPLEFR
ncbi:MAG: hypothetical protein HMLKMBBP_01813 [Planctomycetes bacterium]|nr:hypothetical protein [Planctomycetota bacterium]